MALEFYDDPGEFLRVAGVRLAEDPVLNTVLTTVTERLRDEDAAGVPVDTTVPRWWLATRDDEGELTGVGMRTAPFRPYPLYLLPMPDDAALAARSRPARAGRGDPRHQRRPAGGDGVRRGAGAADRRAGRGRAAHAALRARRAGPARLGPARTTAGGDAGRRRARTRVVRGVRSRRRRAGRPGARVDARHGRGRRHDAPADRRRPGVVLGGRARRPGAPDGRQPAVVRRRARRSGLHAEVAPRPGLRERRRGAGVAADPRRGRAGVPVHRPGQPDVEQDLRGAGLPTRGRHGERRGAAVPPRLGAP